MLIYLVGSLMGGGDVFAVSTVEKAKKVECGISYDATDPLGLITDDNWHNDPSTAFTPVEVAGVAVGSRVWFTTIWFGGEIYDSGREGGWRRVCCAYGTRAEADAALALLKQNPRVNGLDPEVEVARIT